MIGIVGGGIAGLAAAYRLHQHGHEVRVFEANEVGGLAASYETAGDPVEAYYHHLSRSEETITALADDLGVEVEWRVGTNAVYVDDLVHPLDTPWEILAYPRLSLPDTLRLAMLTKGVGFEGFRPRFDAYDDLEAYDGVPAVTFLHREVGGRVYEEFFEPLLEAKFGSRADEVSAAWLLGRVRFRGERDPLRGEVLGYVPGGFSRLVDALVEAIGPERIETGARVEAVGTEDGSVTSLSVATDYGVETHPVDCVVVATMPDVLESLVGYESSVEFQGTICSLLSLSEPLTGTYWLNVAEDAPFGALIEHTEFVPPERYGGEHLLYVARYVQSGEEVVWKMDDDEVRALWLEAISDLFPAFDSGTVNWVRTARNPRTAPIYTCGYLDEVIPYDLSEVAEGLTYAGMASRAQYPERSLDGGVVAGFACADLISDR
ncbi:NAD(P)/FAD-dependent oxidoreductase [Natronorarus salvus]|uniref:NAD(P)/FAD-dependent oxidoreductase n=1 Tax=Natronorarus salvus TaxID=3117733 RepID=UPI002F261C87